MAEPARGALDRVAERFYAALYEDEDARVCTDISDDACHVVPGNFLRNTLASALTKLGDALINPKTTLPWLLTALQAPGWVASLLVPVRESGSMLPQLGIAAWLRQLPVRKWSYVGGAAGQALAVFGLAVTAATLSGAAAGWMVLAGQRSDTSLAYFLLAQGLASMIGGPVWGALADRSSRQVLMLAGLGAGLLGCAVFLVDRWWPALAATAWFLPAAFLVLAVLHDGVRLGRKTYVIDLGGGNKRTDYVAVGNTLIGAFLLVAGGITAVVQTLSTAAAILVLSIAALAAAALAVRLPEVQR